MNLLVIRMLESMILPDGQMIDVGNREIHNEDQRNQNESTTCCN